MPPFVAFSPARQHQRVLHEFDHHMYLLMAAGSDKAGRSIPAPGRGALTVGRQVASKHPLPILDVAAYRSRQLSFRRTL
jgi:hypothetical protein